ncbi:MAG TPA: sugar ABC transporter substrate-binding protein, partial [Methylomirabilota bacterium]|nr:sugar ABC transporter substrate-binding protein [Methylomirabilota bacterium]
GLTADAQAADKKFKIFLSMSYIGNDWQAEAANMVKAMASHKDMRDKVDLEVQVAGPNAQRQIQQINAMVQAGAQAIVTFPISPTALNAAVKNACDKGVLVFAYDAEITEPCAYNISIDQEEAGRVTAEWLAKKLNGKGNIVVITGVPGTSVDTLRTKAAKEVFAKYPDIKIVAEAVGMWSQAVARTELSKILATHSWNDINGLWMQVGCYTANAMELEAGKKQTELLPCAGEGSNGGRIQMLPADAKVEGGDCPYCAMNAPRISYASPPYSGGLALKLAVAKLEGKDVPKRVTLPLPIVTNETIKYCETGSWEEMKAGCNAFPPALVPNPGWFASIFSEQTPEIGFEAALVGQPEP